MPPSIKKFFSRPLHRRLFIAFALLALLTFIAWTLMRMTPSWYVPLDPTSQHVIDLMERAQNSLDLRLGAKLHNAIESVPLDEQSWSISQDEVNALIASRRVGDGAAPLVIFTPGKITFAARSKRIPSSHPDGGVGSIVITISPNNAIKLHRARLGRLPIPKFLVERRLTALAPEIIVAVQQQILLQVGSAPNTQDIEPIITNILRGNPLPPIDANRIIIKAIRIDDGLFTIIFAPSPTPPTKSTTTAPSRSRRR